jgi:hypothetical protein
MSCCMCLAKFSERWTSMAWVEKMIEIIWCKIWFVFLFERLCKSNWGYASVYNRARSDGISFRRIYLQLDEGTLRFNAGQVIDEKELFCSNISCVFYRVCTISLKIDYLMIHAKKLVNLFIILENYERLKNGNYCKHGRFI